MKVIVNIPAADLDEICFFTGEKKKGPAIRKMLMEALMLKRRHQLAEKFLSGEWGAEFEGFEATIAMERQEAEQLDQVWRD